MEETYFNKIRDQFCIQYQHVASGKMMSSEAIVYKEKVFAFFSKKQKMVFKLGKEFKPETVDDEIQVFNPFTKRGPLNGWYEVPFSKKELWIPLAKQALNQLKLQL